MTAMLQMSKLEIAELRGGRRGRVAGSLGCVRARLERRLLSALMTAVAIVLERRLKKLQR